MTGLSNTLSSIRQNWRSLVALRSPENVFWPLQPRDKKSILNDDQLPDLGVHPFPPRHRVIVHAPKKAFLHPGR